MPYREHSYEFKIAVLDEYEAAPVGQKKEVLKRHALHYPTLHRWMTLRNNGELVPAAPKEPVRCTAVSGRCPRSADYANLKLCRRHYKQIAKHGMSGCSQCGAFTPPFRRECDDCIRAEFRSHGYDMLGTYINTHTPVAVKCLECRETFPIRMNNLVTALKRGSRGCGTCWDREHRLTDEYVEGLLAEAGLRKNGTFLNTRTPVACTCTRCGEPYQARVGHIQHRLQRGLRVWGCQDCALKAIRVVEITEHEAIEEFYELGVKDVTGWVNAGTPVDGRCVFCDRPNRPRLTVLRHHSSGACGSCNGRGFWSVSSLLANPQVAEAPAFLYVYEFSDFDKTVFHKVGITRDIDGWSDRLDEHERYGGTLVALASATRIVCRMAELMILRHVGPRAYIPAPDRLAAGHSECYLPGAPIDLETWLREATAKVEELS
jgi:hypothetical protein